MSLIGLLIATLLPSVQRSMDVAAATMCKNNLREVGRAILLYRIDYDGALPMSAPKNEGGLQAIGQTEAWFKPLFPDYLSDPAMLTCPEDPYRFRMMNARDPLNDPNVAEYASYGANEYMMAVALDAGGNPERLRMDDPGKTILAADMGPDRKSGNSTVRQVVGPVRNASMLAWDDGADPFSTEPPPEPWVTVRHGEGINMLTFDSAVREVRTKQVIREPVRRYYQDCASGGCTFCNRYQVSHYSFAKDHLYWWTGPGPGD